MPKTTRRRGAAHPQIDLCNWLTSQPACFPLATTNRSRLGKSRPCANAWRGSLEEGQVYQGTVKQVATNRQGCLRSHGMRQQETAFHLAFTCHSLRNREEEPVKGTRRTASTKDATHRAVITDEGVDFHRYIFDFPRRWRCRLDRRRRRRIPWRSPW